jgi:type IV secretory pathway VirD2 relaxase
MMAGTEGVAGAGADRGEDFAGSVRDRIALRLERSSAGVGHRLVARGGSLSVRSGLAKRLGFAKLFGRGGGAGRQSGARGRPSAFHVSARQRVVVKAFVARHKGRGTAVAGKALATHLRYLARDGAGLDGTYPEFYGADGKEVEDVSDHCAPWADDRHHFRFIISPEHGDKLDDFDGYIRDVMERVATDLNEPGLDWVALNHFDTDQPHAHVLVRGKRASGRDLVIPRKVMAYGFRQRAEERAHELLGEVSRSEAERGLFARTTADYHTDIDRKLESIAASHEGLLPNSELNRTDTFGALARGRVRHLERLGLVERTRDGIRLDGRLKERLTALQISRDQIRDFWHQKGRTVAGRSAADQSLAQGQNEVATQSLPAIRAKKPALDQRSGLERAKPASLNQPLQIGSRGAAIVDADHLTPIDLTIARRTGGERTETLNAADEAAIQARSKFLLRSGYAVETSGGPAFTVDGWQKLKQRELEIAVRDQLGIANRRVIQGISFDEGRVLGHVETVLGRQTIVDRGVSLGAFAARPGQELAVGHVLGLGLER